MELPQIKKVHYVYTLSDPRDNKIFYVGMGKYDRIKAHVIEGKQFIKTGKIKSGANRTKIRLIADIIQSGYTVIETIHKSDMTAEEAALTEKRMIAFCKDKENCKLTNQTKGGEYPKPRIMEYCTPTSPELCNIFDELHNEFNYSII